MAIHPRIRKLLFDTYHKGSLAYDTLTSPKGTQLGLVREQHPGDAARLGKLLCTFAHFDADGRVADYVVYYLRALREQLEADIVFVSTAPRLPESEVAKLKPFCHLIVLRQNRALDFGSWKVGLDCLAAMTPQKTGFRAAIGEYPRFLLANDSVYGPFTDLRRIVDRLPESGANASDSRADSRATPRPGPRAAMIGITDTFERRYHLQSYFLAFNRAAIERPFFAEFWDRFVFLGDKRNIIDQYEVGLSQLALRDGVEMLMQCRYEDVRAKFLASPEATTPFTRRQVRRGPVNPTHLMWRTLIEDFGCPFLKGELAKYNPKLAPDLVQAEPVIQNVSDYPFALIRDHLRRAGINVQV